MLDSSFMANPEVEAARGGWDLTYVPPWGDADPADQLAELATAVADMVGGVHRAVLAFSAGGARAAVGTALRRSLLIFFDKFSLRHQSYRIFLLCS